MLKKIWDILSISVSKMRCVICGGWGGEWGNSQGGRYICKDCWDKGHR